MSKKKIGAYITLEKEKEFRSAVSSCNKELGALRSEMKLVEAQTAGQANTLDTLQKKHNILSKILDEQVEKEAAIKKGLERAGEEYARVGNELQGYKDELQAAKKALEDMKENSETSGEALEQQKKTVELNDPPKMVHRSTEMAELSR